MDHYSRSARNTFSGLTLKRKFAPDAPDREQIPGRALYVVVRGDEILFDAGQDEPLLLGRQPTWGPRVYSALSGYVEPGESAEDGVLREVVEETGIRVCDVRYFSSQPWPFSGSLMLSFHARATNTTTHLDETEREDARWFRRHEIPGLLESGDLVLPSKETIARHLFDAWYSGGKSGRN